MAMAEIVGQYWGADYKFKSSPLSLNGSDVITPELIRKTGANCQLFVHAVYQDLGVPLPRDMLSSELYHDKSYFKTVGDGSLAVGDIAFCTNLRRTGKGHANGDDPQTLHLAVCFQVDRDGALFAHTTARDGVSLWDRTTLDKGDPYRIVAIRRLRSEFHHRIEQNV